MKGIPLLIIDTHKKRETIVCKPISIYSKINPIQIITWYFMHLLESVVFFHIPSVFLCFLVEEHESLTISSVWVEVFLPGQQEVSIPDKALKVNQVVVGIDNEILCVNVLYILKDV